MIRSTLTFASLTAAALMTSMAQAQAPAMAPAAAPAGAPGMPGAMPPAPPRARGPSLALAVEAAQTTVATCLTNGYKVTALIVDSGGATVVLLSGDGAAERTQAIAATKVAAAIRYNMSSGEALEKSKTDAAMAAEIKADPKIGMLRQGALLLKVGNDTVGAIAASGAPGGDKDEVCSKAGIDKIKDRLR